MYIIYSILHGNIKLFVNGLLIFDIYYTLTGVVYSYYIVHFEIKNDDLKSIEHLNIKHTTDTMFV